MSNKLFMPIEMRGLRLHNRVVVSPMSQHYASDGVPTSWHRSHWGSLAESGAGLLMLEGTAIEAVGRLSPEGLGLYTDRQEQAIAGMLSDIKEHGHSALGIQLSHSGRKGSRSSPWNPGGGELLSPESAAGWLPVAPSAIPFLAHEPAPEELDQRGMARICSAFVSSVKRLANMPLDVVQLQFGHGQLMHQFLSPLTNKRTDAYGGALERRMRFPLEVFRAVREAWPDKPLGVRISATDWIQGGWDIEQTVILCQRLATLGCDWFDITSGGLAPQQRIEIAPGYQVPFASRVREETGVVTSAVGLITAPSQAEEIISQGQADMICLARAMLWNPHWAWHAAAVLGGKVAVSKPYHRSLPAGMDNPWMDLA